MKTFIRIRVIRALATLLPGLHRCQSCASPREDALPTKVDNAKVTEAINRAADFLKQAQADDGSFSRRPAPASRRSSPPACCGPAAPTHDPVVAKALKYLEGHVHDDGGIYQNGSNHKNYETCLAIFAFKEANKDSQYDKLLANAEKFVKKEQWDDDEGQEHRRHELRRRRLRPHEPARSVEHQLPDRRAAHARPRRRRSGDAEGADLRLALPEPGIEAQHHAVRREGRTTAASTTPSPPAARARPAIPPTAACAATAR